jgi:RES domain-containing protein
MILYRIAKCNYAADLSGTGARLYGGRWNSVGQPMVYLASGRALAVLEVLVALSPTMLPADFCLVEFEAPENDVLTIDKNILPHNWQDPSAPIQLKQLGDDFLKRKEHLFMKVPSVIIPDDFNYLLNPLHPKATKVKLFGQQPFSFDERLTPPNRPRGGGL